MKSKANEELSGSTIALIVFLIFFLLCIFSVSIWGSCGTDQTAVNFRNTVTDNFAIAKQKVEGFINAQTVIVPPDNPLQKEVKFKKIGDGSAIDKFAIGEYIGPFEGNTIEVPYQLRDDRGNYIPCCVDPDKTKCPTKIECLSGGVCSDMLSSDNETSYCLDITVRTANEYRSTLGFVPPSFAFYPYGKTNTNYKYYNTGDPKDPNNLNVKGNNICMRACSDTNCAAVQIGVPENCAMKITQPVKPFEEATHSCGPLSEASCTLFYNTIEESDDAYYNLYNQKLSTGRSDYLGEKYYILGETPELTPSAGYLPNGENTPVKWCPAYMPPPVGYSENVKGSNIFKTVYGAPDKCSCKGSGQCADENCCKYRPLLTTQGSRAASPYYSLPIDVSKITNSNILQFCNAVQNTGECCGACDDGTGTIKYSSCQGQLLGENNRNSPVYWDTANPGPNGKPESSLCENAEQNDKDPNNFECIATYLFESATIGEKAARNNLSKCNCYYRTRKCFTVGLQPSCDSITSGSNVRRGCAGDPPILITDQVNIAKDKSGKIIDNGIGACSDFSVIPMSFRCEYDDPNKLCTGFAYGCGPESGSLWVRDES
jgi:hypothetical protein